MHFTDDDFPLIEARYYELEDGRMVGPVTPVDDPMPRKWLRVMVWGKGYFEVPGYHHDEETPVKSMLAKPEPEPIPEPVAPDYSEFLSELSALSRKHGVAIAGCGCCGSPFLINTDSRNGKYVVDKRNDNLEFE